MYTSYNVGIGGRRANYRKDEAKAGSGVASNGSNSEQDLEEKLCPKSPSTLELLPRSSSLCDHPCKLAGTKC